MSSYFEWVICKKCHQKIDAKDYTLEEAQTSICEYCQPCDECGAEDHFYEKQCTMTKRDWDEIKGDEKYHQEKED